MRRITRLLTTGILCTLVYSLTQAHATIRQDPAAVYQAIETYLQAQTAGQPGTVTFVIGEIDSRIALPSCAAPEIFLPTGARLSGITSVGVRCIGTTPWSIYVTVQIKVASEYAVAARQLAQGQTLTLADIVLHTGDLTQMPAGVLTNSQQAIGKTLVSAIAAGQALRFDLLRSPIVIQQGQTVRLQSSGNGFRVSADGKSLNNASVGQIVQVRGSSGQTISGIARAGGIVEINF